MKFHSIVLANEINNMDNIYNAKLNQNTSVLCITLLVPSVDCIYSKLNTDYIYREIFIRDALASQKRRCYVVSHCDMMCSGECPYHTLTHVHAANIALLIIDHKALLLKVSRSSLLSHQRLNTQHGYLIIEENSQVRLVHSTKQYGLGAYPADEGFRQADVNQKCCQCRCSVQQCIYQRNALRRGK